MVAERRTTKSEGNLALVPQPQYVGTETSEVGAAFLEEEEP